MHSANLVAGLIWQFSTGLPYARMTIKFYICKKFVADFNLVITATYVCAVKTANNNDMVMVVTTC